MTRLLDKVALVTGAGSGIGAEISKRFAHEGARVFAVDRDLEACTLTALTINEEGGSATAVRCDVTDAGDVREAVDRAYHEANGIDIVVNNAGISVLGAVHTLSEDDWDRQIDTNLKSVFLVTRAAWPHLIKRGGGVVLNTGSCWDCGPNQTTQQRTAPPKLPS